MSFKFTYLPLYQLVQKNNILFGCKNKNFSYIKAKPTKKFGSNGFLRGRLSTDRADLRGFPIDDFCPNPNWWRHWRG